MKLTNEDLKELQEKSLSEKIEISRTILQDYYKKTNGKIYVAFSGGKDSVVLLDIVRSVYPNTIGVYSNTGLEYPEIVEFVKTVPNIQIIRPKVSFKEVIQKHGYPVFSKKISRMVSIIQNPTERNHKTRKLYIEGVNSNGIKSPNWKIPDKYLYLIDAPFKMSDACCKYLKKAPFQNFEAETKMNRILGLMAIDGEYRKYSIKKRGFNHYAERNNYSTPLGFWTRSDVWEYIYKNKLPYCKVLYGDIILQKTLDGNAVYNNDGLYGTGCMFCMFGIEQENKLKRPNRFQLMKETHPKLYKYCMDDLGIQKVLEYIKIPYR